MSMGVTGSLALGIAQAEQRQNTLANDIANANTPGFQAQDVSFHKTLSGTMQTSVVSAPQFQTANGNGVDGAAVMTALERNALQLSGSATLLTGRLQTIQSAITALQGA